jgi:hypothetical protein
MRTHEVSREQWKGFFDDFSRRHASWLAKVVAVNERLGAQIEAHELSLQGVFYEPDRNAITLLLEKGTSGHVERPVRAPQRAWIEVSEDGDEEALKIEVLDGTKTILEFHVSTRAEPLRGLSR